MDRQSRIITGNQAFWDRVKKLTGKDEDEVTNADFVQDRVKVFFESYERAFKGEAFSIVRQRESSGRQIYEELSFNPIRDLHDDVIGVNCFLRDITDPRSTCIRSKRRIDACARSPGSSLTGFAPL